MLISYESMVPALAPEADQRQHWRTNLEVFVQHHDGLVELFLQMLIKLNLVAEKIDLGKWKVLPHWWWFEIIEDIVDASADSPRFY